MKPNYAEVTSLLGTAALERFRIRADAVAAYRDRILELTGAQIAAVTLDCDGAMIFEKNRDPYRTIARAQRNSSAVGAGDTYTATFAIALAAGGTAHEAAELAAAASALVISKERTATCTAAELRDYVGAGGKYVADAEQMQKKLALYRQQGKRVVFTNGCFDILHRGHITYLHRARSLGDVLIVGVNSDESIRKLKGPGRPINNLEDRVQVLAALGCLDHLIAFHEDTPCNLVATIRPDVFVKGGDYTRKRLPEAAIVEAYGGVVQILPFLAERSTTRIIERIQAGPGDPTPSGAVAVKGAGT